MKKTYLKPETTVVALNVRENVLQASEKVLMGGNYNGSTSIEAREVIQENIDAPDAWEEW
jgi:hypothetical protein